MQVRAEDGPVFPSLAERRADLHVVADLHRDAARLQVRVDREDVRRDLEHHLVAAEVRLRLRDHRHVRGRSGLPSWTETTVPSATASTSAPKA